jgi:uncharacterized protein (DUF4415 family)
MPTAKKPTTTSKLFSAAEIAAAKAAAAASTTAAPKVSKAPKTNWAQGAVTPGGGVASTIAALRRTRGPAKKPAKEQVAIRLDPDLVGALRASGPGWQTRVNAALKEWLASQPAKHKATRRAGRVGGRADR